MNLSPVASQRRASHPVSALQTSEDGLSPMLVEQKPRSPRRGLFWRVSFESTAGMELCHVRVRNAVCAQARQSSGRGSELSCRRYSFGNAALIADAYQIIAPLMVWGDCFESALNA
jgi:hypothetical protein